MNSPTPKAVVLLSGGLDSATVLGKWIRAQASTRFDFPPFGAGTARNAIAGTITYTGRQQAELSAARRCFCGVCGVCVVFAGINSAMIANAITTANMPIMN
jgi:NH3-dependent NAD+ synthetase